MAMRRYIFARTSVYVHPTSGDKYTYQASGHAISIGDVDIQAWVAGLPAGSVTDLTALEDLPERLSDVEALVAAGEDGFVPYLTKADLDADTSPAVNWGFVYDDATPANNGRYVFTPGSPGSWAKTSFQSADAADLAGKADAVVTISGSGLATGGGDLSANRTLTVPAADEATAKAGASAAHAMTPLGVSQFASQLDSLRINRGRAFPLKSETLNSVTSSENTGWSDFVLAARVNNADPAYFYRLVFHYGPDHGSAFKWIIERHLRSTFGTEDTGEPIHPVTIAGPVYDPAGGVQQLSFECAGYQESVDLFIDADANPGSGTIDSNGAGDDGYSWVIDPANYIVNDAIAGPLSASQYNEWPFQNRTRDATDYGISPQAKSIFRGAEVYGAKPGKIYRIGYLAVNFTAQGVEKTHSIQLEEYDEATFDTDSAASQLILMYTSDQDFSTIEDGGEDIVSRYFVCKQDPTVQVKVTYSQAAFDGDVAHSMLAAGDDYGLIIHPDNYHHTQAEPGGDAENVLVRRRGEELDVIWRDPYAAADFKVVIKRFGANDLVQFGHVYTRNARENLSLINADWEGVTSAWTTVYESDTDWIGPTVVEAQANGDGSTAKKFMGGNHAYDAQGDQDPDGTSTAQTMSVSYLNPQTGREIRDGESLVLDRVIANIHNEVAAWNTYSLGRYVLDEFVTLSISRYGVAPAVTHRFREAVNLSKYYGMQSAVADYWGTTSATKCRFAHNGDQTRQDWDNANFLYSDTWDVSPDVDRMAITGSGLRHMVMWLDTSFGLADGAMVDQAAYGRFFTSSTKCYTTLVRVQSGAGYPIAAGEAVSWRGVYLFTSGMADGFVAGYWARDVFGRWVFLADSIGSSEVTTLPFVPPGAAGADFADANSVVTGPITVADQPAAGKVALTASGASSVTLRL